MKLEEAYRNMSDIELLERYAEITNYFIEVQELIVKEIRRRGLNESIEEELKVCEERIEHEKMLKEIKRIEKEEKMKKLNKKLQIAGVTIVIIFFLIIQIVPIFNHKSYNRETEEITEEIQKPVYKNIILADKYPDEFSYPWKLKQKLKENVVREEKEQQGKQIIYRYFDKKNREIYRIEENISVNKMSWHSGRGGAGSVKRSYPDEYGVLYSDDGKKEAELQIKGLNEYTLNSDTDSKRHSMFNDGDNQGEESIIRYFYDKNGNLIKEKRATPTLYFEMSEVYYKNGKKTGEKIINDCEYPESASSYIYVEITKDYDKNEKMVKKFVLRKNKFNAIRSETNFDLIKGEIVTKYYEGDKAFATVTETLIGKDRAIVKREREGDEFVIWDFVRKAEKGNGRYDKYYINKNDNRLMYVFRQCDYLSEYGFNHGEKGIKKETFAEDVFSNELNRDIIYNGAVFTEMEEYLNNTKIVYITTDKKSADSFFVYYTQNEKEKFLGERIEKNKTEIILEKININKMEEDFRNGY